MALSEHFRELRRRIVIAALAVLAGAVVGWIYSEPIFRVLQEPITAYQAAHPNRTVELNNAGLTTSFSLRLSLAIWSGIILSSPIWLMQIWGFIVPGLTKREKRISRVFIAVAVPLFAAGVWLAKTSLPLVTTVLLDFTQQNVANIQQQTDYISFITRFILAFGFAFLLPVFLVGLNMIGILPAAAMRKGWRVAVFVIFLFSAMMMPTPDPYTMFLLAAPLTVLFFAALGVATLMDRRRRRTRPEWLDGDDETASAIERPADL